MDTRRTAAWIGRVRVMKTSGSHRRGAFVCLVAIVLSGMWPACPSPATVRADDASATETPRAWAGAVASGGGRETVRVASLPDPSIADPAAPSDQGSLIPTGSLLSLVHDGGILMVPLLGCSFLLAVFGIERVVSLRWGRVVPRLFVNRFLEQLEASEIGRDEALDACEANGSPVANVFAAAARRWGKPAVEIEQAVIDACERELILLRRYRRVFQSVATIGPLLGLLGTVFGLIRSFNDVASAGAMGRPDLLAKGFGEALITTAMGLLVAIPAMLLHSIFTSRADRLALEFDRTAQQVIDCIALETANDPRRRQRRGRAAAGKG